MTYMPPKPDQQITHRDREFTPSPSLMKVTQQDRLSLQEKAAGIAKSGLYKEINTPEKALVVMMMGRALGVNELTALQGIYIINGRPWVSADLIFALVRAKKICKNMEASTSLEGARCKMTRVDDGFTFEAFFGPEEAKRGGLTGKDTYQKFPDQMYLHRAVRRCCTMVCPEILMGIGIDEDGFPQQVAASGEEYEAQVAAELADKEQLAKDRAAYYAKTAQRDSDWKPATTQAARANTIEEGAVDAEIGDGGEGYEGPTPEPEVELILGDDLGAAMDLFSVISEKPEYDALKFGDWLDKHFGSRTIEGVAADRGDDLIKAMRKHAADKPETKKTSNFK